MTTIWTLPSDVNQYTEDDAHIAWNNVDNFNGLTGATGKSFSTVAPLLHIARQPRNDITMKTYFLKLTGFNFSSVPDTISGIEVKLEMNRGGRISDETVQLCLNNELIGENRAKLTLNPIQVYGSSTDTWAVDNLNLDMIQDPSFGVIVRFRSHPQWPHKTAPLISSIEMQIY